MNVTRNNRKIVVSVAMALMMVLAMMPGMAFAQSVVAGYDVAIQNPGTILTGTNPQVTADITQPAGTTVHIDWTSSNESVATIGTHKGKITPVAAGTTTITATLREGEAPTGTGSGTGGDCTGTILATDSITVTVQASTAYGYQGIGGNTMLMTTPSNITGGQLTADGYYNVINDTIALTADGSSDFSFTMSAGMNNFNPQDFKDNSLPHIKVLDLDETQVSGTSVEYQSISNNNITIKVSGLMSGEYYILQFGSDVCGNNVAKKLGIPVNFQFDAE